MRDSCWAKHKHKNWTAHTTCTPQIYMYVLYILPGTLYPLSCGLLTGNLIRKYNKYSCWQMKTVTESLKCFYLLDNKTTVNPYDNVLEE